MESVSGLIEQKYGTKKEEVKSRLRDIYSRFADKADRSSDDLKTNLRH
jgi:hypothetical protein